MVFTALQHSLVNTFHSSFKHCERGIKIKKVRICHTDEPFMEIIDTIDSARSDSVKKMIMDDGSESFGLLFIQA